MLLVLVLLLHLADTEAFLFPSRCFNENTTVPVRCCPDFGGTPCGEGQGRGTCVSVTPSLNRDDRAGFPDSFVTHKCSCSGTYGGVDCGRCKFNYEGDLCNRMRVRERIEMRQMTPVEVEKFNAQMNYCKDTMDPDYNILISGDRAKKETYKFRQATYLDVMTYGYYYATKPWGGRGSHIHGQTAMLAFNRMFVNKLEQTMQRCLQNVSFTMPYYDWQNDTGCDICNNTYMGDTNDEGYISDGSIYATWRMICGGYDFSEALCLLTKCECELPKLIRRISLTPGIKKPTTPDMQSCMRIRTFDSPPYDGTSRSGFRPCLEGFWFDSRGNSVLATHRLWLEYIGGTMSQNHMAINDPLYMMQLVLLDKYYERWINYYGITENDYPDNGIEGQRPNNCTTPCYECETYKSLVRPLARVYVTYSTYIF